MLRCRPSCRSLLLLGGLCLGPSGLVAQGPNPEARDFAPVDQGAPESSARVTGLPPEQAASMRQHALQVLAEASERFGPAQPFAVHWQEGPFEVRHTPTALHLQSDRTPRDLADSEGAAVIRQVAEAYVGGEGWLSHGAAEYRLLLLGLALRNADTDDALRALSSLYEHYRDGRFAQDLASSNDVPWQRAGSALALYCLDGELRAAGSSFESIHRQSLSEGRLDESLFLAQLRSVHPEAAENLARRASYRGVFDVHHCFEAAGLQVTAQARRRIDDAAWHRLLRGERLPDGPPTITSVEGGPLRPGDRIRYVRGQRVHSWDEIARLIDGLPPYREIPVAVDRHGEQIVVNLTMVGLPRISGSRERFRLIVSRQGLSAHFPLAPAATDTSLAQVAPGHN